MTFKSKDIVLNSYLIEAALKELSLLEKIDQLKYLYNPNVINEALRRYETLWMPLMKQYNGQMAAPIDIYWIWHVHMLSPAAYRSDMEAHTGKIFDHKFLSNTEHDKALTPIKTLWSQRYPTESFDLDRHKIRKMFVSQLSYDIESAAIRQSSFFYQVSLPHYRSREFLDQSLLRYKMFLFLKKQYPQQFITPCYDIDLIWHTHQLHPLSYFNDCIRILGRILPHDDSVNDRSVGSKLRQAETATKELWLSTFQTPFSNPGSMYRGNSSYRQLSEPEQSLLFTLYKDRRISLTLDCDITRTTPSKHILHIYLMTHTGKNKCIYKYDYETMTLRSVKTSWIFDTKRNTGFRVKLKKKTSLCYRPKMFAGELITSGCFLLMDQTNVGNTLSYNMNITEKNNLFDTVTMKVVPQSVNVQDHFIGTVQLGEFFCVTLNLSDPNIWCSIPTTMIDDTSTEGIMASHRIQSINAKQTFTINVIHATKLKQSIVQVYLEKKLLVVGHLLGTDQLPILLKDNSEYPSLNIKQAHVAMIIKDHCGDWAIIVAYWTGMKAGVPGTRGSRGVRGSPGFLDLKVFHLRPCRKSIHLSITSLDNISFIIDDLHVNLTTGTVVFKSFEKMPLLPNYVGLSFVIAILYVLCKPRTIINANQNPISENDRNNKLLLNSDINIIGRPGVCEVKTSTKRGNRKVNDSNCGDACFFLASGYMYGCYIPCNSYYHQYVYSSSCAGCVGNGTCGDEVGGCGGCGGCGGGGDWGGGGGCGGGC